MILSVLSLVANWQQSLLQATSPIVFLGSHESRLYRKPFVGKCLIANGCCRYGSRSLDPRRVILYSIQCLLTRSPRLIWLSRRGFCPTIRAQLVHIRLELLSECWWSVQDDLHINCKQSHVSWFPERWSCIFMLKIFDQSLDSSFFRIKKSMKLSMQNITFVKLTSWSIPRLLLQWSLVTNLSTIDNHTDFMVASSTLFQNM